MAPPPHTASNRIPYSIPLPCPPLPLPLQRVTAQFSAEQQAFLDRKRSESRGAAPAAPVSEQAAGSLSSWGRGVAWVCLAMHLAAQLLDLYVLTCACCACLC